MVVFVLKMAATDVTKKLTLSVKIKKGTRLDLPKSSYKKESDDLSRTAPH